MTEVERKLIAKKIDDCAALFGKLDFTAKTISVYLNLFESHFDNSCAEILTAYDLYMKDPKNKFFPAPAHIREYLPNNSSNDDMSKIIASKIIESVKKFGWNKGNEVKEYIGEHGWEAILRWGGWEYLCSQLGDGISLTTFQAQTRDMLKSNLNVSDCNNYNSNQIENTKKILQIGSVISSSTRDLTKIK